MENILSHTETAKIDNVCIKYDIVNYTINNDGSIDVTGTVDLSDNNLKKLPLRFNKVSGDFLCNDNHLISLIGCPVEVGCSFNCSFNELDSLEFAPKKVGEDFDCSFNILKTLNFSPETIRNNFYCSENEITSLVGCPLVVRGDLILYWNNLPRHFSQLFVKLNSADKSIFIKYQHDLRIWDGEYKEEAAQDLFDEIKDGMR